MNINSVFVIKVSMDFPLERTTYPKNSLNREVSPKILSGPKWAFGLFNESDTRYVQNICILHTDFNHKYLTPI